jgi:hypothetical protein
MTRRKLAVLLAGLIVLVSAALAAAPPKSKAKGPAERFEVNGSIAGYQQGHVVVVKTSGKGQHSASTHADGTFVLRALLPGSYTVRPQSQYYHFTPAFRTVAVTTHDVQGVSFTAHVAQPQKKK